MLHAEIHDREDILGVGARGHAAANFCVDGGWRWGLDFGEECAEVHEVLGLNLEIRVGVVGGEKFCAKLPANLEKAVTIGADA